MAKGVLITILVLRDQGSLRDLLDPGIRVMPVAGQRLRYAIPGLRRAIRAIAPRFVVSSESGLNLCSLVAVRTLSRRDRPQLLLREVGSPSIAQYHDPYRQNRFAYRILRHLYRHADRIIMLTDSARRDLAQNFSVPQRSMAVMRANAVIPPAMVERIARWDGEAGREGGLIVCVGRLSPEKDHRTLLRAMSLLPPQRSWRLAIVGEGPERPALEACVRQLGLAQRVTFTGYVADPFAWMMRARLAICSSVYEGLCNAIIEALACGTPVVSTDCPYGPREILQDGRYGTLTPVGDEAALAAAIEAALDQVVDRHFLMTRGLNYTADSAATKFLEIVADLPLHRSRADWPVVAAP
ncbi:MAG TPA: glycosyltransferase [Xanthobacteraceae bacterium]